MMDLSFILIFIFLVINFLFLIFFFFRKKDDKSESLLLLQKQLEKITETNEKLVASNYELKQELSDRISQKLSQNQKEMSESVKDQFVQSQKLIKDITEELYGVKKSSEEVASFAKGLKNLQDILLNSKQRGALGEYFLENTIKNILPPESYEFQYSFKNGEIADAVIKLPDGIIAIDSKFSLENYNKIINENDLDKRKILEKNFKEDLKKRIAETAKYIKPKEGTMDFAFMFIPSEGIYYDLLVSKVGVVNSQNFLEYAFRDKKVIVVSPSTLYAYLQTVMQGLKALKIEKKAGLISKKVSDLQKHLDNYITRHEKLGKSISAAVNHYNDSSKSLKKISNDTLKITGEGEVFEPEMIDGPKDD